MIGIRLIPLLIAAGHQVTAVVRSQSKAEQSRLAGAQPVQIDLFDRESVSQVVRGHDAIINLVTHIPPSSRAFFRSAWVENDRLRKSVSANLVNAAIASGVRRFLQESFAPVYMDGGDQWIDESWPIEPVSYNRTVLDAEKAANEFSESGGTGVILRFSFFYGPDPGGATLDIIRILRKGWVPLPVSPDGFISSLSHDDAATAVVEALQIPAGIFNVTDHEPVRRREFFNSLAEALGISHPKFPPKWLGSLTGSIGKMLSRSLRISNRKLCAASEWKPKYPSVREGWQALVQQLARSRSNH